MTLTMAQHMTKRKRGYMKNAEEFKTRIQKSIAIESAVVVSSPSAAKYDFHKMEVGHSFFIPEGEEKRVRSAACIYGKRTDKEFSVRKVKRGYRCWRIK